MEGVEDPLPIFPSAIPFLLPPQISLHRRDLSANRRRRDVGADGAPERGADGDDAGRRQGAAHRRDPRARAPEEEVGCADGAVPRHPQEDRGHQGVHGRGHARLLLLPRRGQVRGRRRRPPRGPPVRPLRLPPRPLPPGERRGRQAPQVLPLRRPRRRRHRRRPHEPDRPRARRAAGHRLPRRARQGHRGARRARVPPDLLPHPRRGHQDHQPPCQRPRERRQAQAREHHHLHQGGAGRARARGLLQAQEDPGLQEEGGREADERGQAVCGGAACGGSVTQEGHLHGGRGQHTGWGRRQGRRHHLLITPVYLIIQSWWRLSFGAWSSRISSVYRVAEVFVSDSSLNSGHPRPRIIICTTWEPNVADEV